MKSIYDNGIYNVAKRDHPEWPLVVRPYPDLGKLRERVMRDESDAIKTAKHMTRVTIEREPCMQSLRDDYNAKRRGSYDEIMDEMTAENLRLQKGKKRRATRIRKHKKLMEQKRSNKAMEAVAIRRSANATSKWSTAHTQCIAANPIAQVYKFTGYPNNKQIKHTLGDFAVMVWDKVERNEEGHPIVFKTPYEAYDHANHLLDKWPERFIWYEPNGTIVFEWENTQILYDPETYGLDMPFIVWISKHDKPRLKLGRPNYQGNFKKIPADATPEDRAMLEAFNRKEQIKVEEFGRSFDPVIKKFKTITGAFNELCQVEKELGNRRPVVRADVPPAPEDMEGYT